MPQQPQNPSRIGLRIEPLDTLFFRGGKPMASGSRNRSELPNPQSLLGMMRTFLWRENGCDFDRLPRELRSSPVSLREAAIQAGTTPWAAGIEVRGPWLAHFGAAEPVVRELYLPAPANLEPAGPGYFALHPSGTALPGLGQKHPLWNKAWAANRVSFSENASTGKDAGKDAAKDGASRNAAAQKKAEFGFLPASKLATYLSGNAHLADLSLVPASKLYTHEPKVGIAINPGTGHVEEGHLFSTDLLRLTGDLSNGFYAELLVEDAEAARACLAKPVILNLGGEARAVSVSAVKPYPWPKPTGQGKPFLYALAPTFFAEGSGPSHIGGEPVVAASVREAFSASGWDLARRGPKPVRFGAAAGSVFFMESSRIAETLTSLCSDPEDRAAGYGTALQGVWNYA